MGWPCVAGTEADGSPGGGGPGTALCSPAERAAGGPGHSGLPPGHCGSSVWPLPHQGGLQPIRSDDQNNKNHHVVNDSHVSLF